jgi:hypothetical protein
MQVEAIGCHRKQAFARKTPLGKVCSSYACNVLRDMRKYLGEKIQKYLGIENVPFEELPEALNGTVELLNRKFKENHKKIILLEKEIHNNKERDGNSTPNASQELPQLVYKTSPNKYTVHCSQSSLK